MAQISTGQTISSVIVSLYETAVKAQVTYKADQEYAFYAGYLAALDNVRQALPRKAPDDE